MNIGVQISFQMVFVIFRHIPRSGIAGSYSSSCRGFPGGSEGKESACNVGDLGLIPELGRSPGEVNGYPLQYSCLKNSMDRGPWQV